MNKKFKWIIYTLIVLIILFLMIFLSFNKGLDNYFENLKSNYLLALCPVLGGVVLINLLAIFFNPDVEFMRLDMFLDSYISSVKTYFADFLPQLILSIAMGLFAGVLSGIFGGFFLSLFFNFPSEEINLLKIVTVGIPFALIVSSVLAAIGRCFVAFLGPLLAFLAALIIANFLGGIFVGLVMGLISALVFTGLLFVE